MIFQQTTLSGAWLIRLEPNQDERGFFARSFCQKEFEQHQLSGKFVQCNLSYNQTRGTLRGLHYQQAPFEETKVVSCHIGAIYDVIVDLRSHSSSYGQWEAFELSAENHHSLYIPTGLAHGFQTLTDHTEVSYMMGNYYQPDAARGIRWNDPTLNIPWPISETIISLRDQHFPVFQP